MKEKPEILIKGGDYLERTGKFINPDVTDLRNSDANLLGRFKPKYYAFIQQCQYCAFGPCDLSKNRRGACGMRLNPQMAREALVTAIAGASSYIARACELNDAIIKEHTYFAELLLEDKNFITTTFINLLCGYEPKTTGDLKKALRYANEQIVHLISATHMGQEASDFDFNSKIFHAGMLSLLAMEIYEILRKFSNNNEGNKINKFEIGFGAIYKSKGIVLIIGDYVPNIAQIINSSADFEIIHLGSGAFDFNEGVKICENSASELIYEKTGLADVIVIGTGNVRTDVIENVKKSGTPVIAVSDRNMAGLADLSILSSDEIFKKLMDGEISGCYIKDSKKLADVVGMIATANKKGRNLKNFNTDTTDAGLIKTTGECINCGLCKKACPVNIAPRLIIQSINRIFNNKTESCETKTGEDMLAPPVKSKNKTKDKLINLLKQKEYTATNLAKETGCSRQYIYNVLKKFSKKKGSEFTSLHSEISEACPEITKRVVGKDTYYSLIKGLNEYYKITGQIKECIGCKLCSENCPNNIQISDLIIAIKEGKEIKAKEISILKKCVMCGLCQEKCPKKINIKEVVRGERERRNIIEDIKFLTKEEILGALEKCIFCGRCESQCPKQIPIISVFAEIYKEKFMDKKASITFSHANISIPKDTQVLLVLGDANFPNGTQELAEILEEFLNRNFIIFTAGDAAISICSLRSCISKSEIAESNSTYKNLINLGSLSAGIHLIEKVIEMTGKNIDKSPVGNFDEISDYITNKIGITALFWGATTQENFAVAQGLMRLGIPVIFGRQGIKYRRELTRDIVIDYSKDDYNGNYNEVLKKISPKNFSFPHLCIAAKTKEEAMLLITKLVFRNFDSEEVRAKKIADYIEIYRKYGGDKTKEIPDDIKNFVRSEKDIPEAYKNSIQK